MERGATAVIGSVVESGRSQLTTAEAASAATTVRRRRSLRRANRHDSLCLNVMTAPQSSRADAKRAWRAPQRGPKNDRAANVDPCRLAGGPAGVAARMPRQPRDSASPPFGGFALARGAPQLRGWAHL